MRNALLAAFVFAAVVPPAMAVGNDTPAVAAQNFYKVYATFHPSDGIPDAAGRAKYAPYISAQLNGLLTAARAAEETFLAKNKDTPPLIEGDLMTSNFEGATSFKVGDCTGDAKRAHCPV